MGIVAVRLSRVAVACVTPLKGCVTRRDSATPVASATRRDRTCDVRHSNNNGTSRTRMVSLRERAEINDPFHV